MSICRYKICILHQTCEYSLFFFYGRMSGWFFQEPTYRWRMSVLSSQLLHCKDGCRYLHNVPQWAPLYPPIILDAVKFNFFFTLQWRIQDFPEVGAPISWRGGGRRRQHTILPNFPKNCMKLKEFGPGDPPLLYIISIKVFKIKYNKW